MEVWLQIYFIGLQWISAKTTELNVTINVTCTSFPDDDRCEGEKTEEKVQTAAGGKHSSES